jgi:hypothetical protein
VLLVACPRLAVAQVVQNSDFEAVQIGSPFSSNNPADIPGWTHTGSADALMFAVGYSDGGGSVTTAGHGNQFVTLGPGFNAGGQGSWSQAVTGFTIGQTYNLSFMMASEINNLSQGIAVDFPTGSATPTQTFTAGPSSANYWRSWEAKNMDFIASNSSVTLRFTSTTTDDVGLDNVKLTVAGVSTPEPGTIGLCAGLIASVGGISLRRRRRK